MIVSNETEKMNPMTELSLDSYADNDFTRWVDWARKFAYLLEKSLLSNEEKSVVRSVLDIKEVR